MLEIVCGNPSQKPASYTRFILPFAYRPQKIASGVSDFTYKVFEPEELTWRQRYLTHETADVLFRRAKWVVLDGKSGQEIEIQFSRGNTLTVCVSPPELVLFEWPNNENDTENEILRTGFLIIGIYFPEQNHAQPCLDNLLELNEVFKYWQQPFTRHEEIGKYRELLKNLPYRINESKTIGFMENSRELYFERWACLLEFPLFDEGGSCWKLIPNEWMAKARRKVEGHAEKIDSDGTEDWMVYADNRTFVWTCSLMENGANSLRESCLPGDLVSSSGYWRRLLNIDPPGYNHNTKFEEKWTDEHTFKRWEESGTLYGFSYHSGAMLGPSCNEPPLWKHFGQMYFDQAMLLLYLRVGLFRFSHALSQISSRVIDAKIDKKKWLIEFSRLRKEFSLFTNLYQFPLISNQQQGVEMYGAARKSMGVNELFREVQDEINSCHDYLSIEEAQEQTRSTTRLTVVATVGLSFALAISVWEKNKTFLDFYLFLKDSYFLLAVLLFLIFTCLIIFYSETLSKIFDWLANQGKGVKKIDRRHVLKKRSKRER